VLANFRNAVAQDDVLGGNAGVVQLVGQSFFGPVVLDPDFVADEVNVGELAVDSLLAAPTDLDDQVVVVVSVKNRLELNLADRRRDLCVGEKDLFDDVAIAVYGIHCDGPAVLGEGVSHGIVIGVSGGHEQGISQCGQFITATSS
jgi:hypothetical protein